MKNRIALILTLSPFFILYSCSRNCGSRVDVEFPSPYSSPIWHPDGRTIAFNWMPIAHVYKSTDPCTQDSYDYKADSIGFWLINKDGTHLRRVASFEPLNPSWSPDGKWIAFSLGINIFKMPYDGYNFDTLRLMQLTTQGENFYPCWNSTSDTIYFDSADPLSKSPSRVFKMAADGTGRTLIGNHGVDSLYNRQPFYVSQQMVLHVRVDTASSHVYSMDANGNHVKNLTQNDSKNNEISNIRFFNNSIYYENLGLWKADADGSHLRKIFDQPSEGFSISKNGEIAFVPFDYRTIDHSHGVIWLMDVNGQNLRQLTYNTY